MSGTTYLQSIVFCLFLVGLHTQELSQGISNIEKLKAAINKGPNRKVGFERSFLYNEIGFVLPNITEVVICGFKHVSIKCDNGDDLLKLVNDGTLLAGMLLEYHPHEEKDSQFYRQFGVFSSSVIQPQAILMAPDVSPTMPHGAPSGRSSRDLLKAINSAIVHVQNSGLDQVLRKKYSSLFPDTSNLEIQTCTRKDYDAFAVPNKSQASGLLKKILATKVLKISMYDKLLEINEPTHQYYADLTRAIVAELGKLSGPDGEVYGSGIRIEGIHAPGFVSKPEQFRHVLEGLSDMSAPYHEIDEVYRGTHEPCNSNKDCRPALLPGGTELCNNYTTFYGEPVKNSTTGDRLKRCEHPPEVAMDIFSHGCSILSTERFFFAQSPKKSTKESTTKKSTTKAIKIIAEKNESSDRTAIGFAIGIPTIVAIVALAFICFLIYKEKQGRPLFYK